MRSTVPGDAVSKPSGAVYHGSSLGGTGEALVSAGSGEDSAGRHNKEKSAGNRLKESIISKFEVWLDSKAWLGSTEETATYRGNALYFGDFVQGGFQS